MNLADLAGENLQRFGEYEALVFEGRAYTNAELDRMASSVASGLIRAGVSRGDRVAVVLPNCPEVLVSYQAIARAGGVIVPLLGALEVSEIRHILRDCAPSLAIAGPDEAAKVRQAAPGLPMAVAAGQKTEFPAGALPFHTLVQSPALELGPGPDGSDIAVILYTSGTTGQPKGVMLSHTNLVSNAIAGARARGVRREHTVMLVLPLSHTYGLTVMNSQMITGCRAVMLPRFDPERFCRAVQEYRVYQASVVPAMLAMLLRHPALDRYDVSSLAYVSCGSSPCPAEVRHEFQRRTRCRVLEGYGLTETAPTVCVQRPRRRNKEGSVGIPVEGVEVRVVDEFGADLPAGEVGELLVKGPNVMLGYYNLPEETAATLQDGWCRTGDMARIDRDGEIFIVDRKKDLIIRGGFNIYPRDIEEVLYRHPSVVESAVVGVPDPVMGEKVRAYVVLKPGSRASEEELIGWCRRYLARYKAPERVEFLEMLPRNGLGKVDKRELRRRSTPD